MGSEANTGAKTGVSQAHAGDVLARAIATKVRLRLNADVFGEERTLTAAPVKLLGDSISDGLWVHFPDEPPETINKIDEARPLCRAGCCVDRVRYSFETSVAGRDKHFWLNDQIMLDAVLLEAPKNFQQLQERAAERFAVSDRCGVSAQLFRVMAPGATAAEAARKQLIPIPATLKDLSTGGGGFVCPFERTLAAANRGDPMGCILNFRGERISLVATLAQVSPISSRTLRLGIKFQTPLDGVVALEKKQQVQKVIDELQRQKSVRQQVRRAS